MNCRYSDKLRCPQITFDTITGKISIPEKPCYIVNVNGKQGVYSGCRHSPLYNDFLKMLTSVIVEEI